MTKQKRRYWRGVNVSGAEFGANLPGVEGTDYTWNNEETYRYFAQQGFDLFRIPFLWERIQPVMNAPLDPGYLAGLQRCVDWAGKYGGVAVLDMHNYGRYHGTIIDAGEVRTANLCDVWKRLSDVFRDDENIYAYGIMNEPHDMGKYSWDPMAQAVVDTIRANGDNTAITIPHDNWTGAHSWPADREPWIHDPADHLFYEAHQYFDVDSSGTYKKTYDEEMTLQEDLVNTGVRRMQKLIDWSKKYHVRVFLGEFGIPGNDPRWFEVMDRFIACLDEAEIDSAYWSTGTWWGEDTMAVQPKDNFQTPAPQLATLKKHLSQQ